MQVLRLQGPVHCMELLGPLLAGPVLLAALQCSKQLHPWPKTLRGASPRWQPGSSLTSATQVCQQNVSNDCQWHVVRQQQHLVLHSLCIAAVFHSVAAGKAPLAALVTGAVGVRCAYAGSRRSSLGSRYIPSVSNEPLTSHLDSLTAGKQYASSYTLLQTPSIQLLCNGSSFCCFLLKC